ncbi:MAG: hypothetical protein ACLR23_09485 [Clostridia bacterium]
MAGKPLREDLRAWQITAKAFSYVKKRVAEGLPLDEAATKDIHALLMQNILIGGIYRSVEVRVSGAGFKPPCTH